MTPSAQNSKMFRYSVQAFFVSFFFVRSKMEVSDEIFLARRLEYFPPSSCVIKLDSTIIPAYISIWREDHFCFLGLTDIILEAGAAKESENHRKNLLRFQNASL
eukprot:Gregarina_sp_Poly_1__6032@NODE_3180_length_1294_cov_13_162999_g2020_i0_p1_GENE_NODE_3180_length_1294_cov_13_162999_g2020_i0NODE_3180_length_1294_cov_13_162999_g2020_i0_p1_ORF_typecomplete_len104_score15_68_NODE_3180_length_1294_cov_13_162999_g2020_i0221532